MTNLMVWFRKNNKKLMAVVVIALMIVFTIEPVMNYLSSRRAGGYDVIARYADDQKITVRDRLWAQKQLEILKALRADVIFRPVDLRLNPSQDLRLVLLGELLFAERANAATTISYVRQIIRRENLAVKDEQINALYEKEYPADLYWILLVKESRLAGVRMPLEPAKGQLEIIIPRLQQGLTYSQFMEGIVRNFQMSEEQVIETFADVMGIVEFARISCSLGNRTAQQLLLETVLQNETLDVEYVPLGADLFISDVREPAEAQITQQYEKFKNEFSNNFNESNPYGFGYKLPDRIRLEYIAVRLDDVAKKVSRPTQQEMEDFYQQNISRFEEEVPADPNDPNSETTLRTRTFAEVAGLISKAMLQQKVEMKASQIISQARSITEADLAGIEDQQIKITDEEIKSKAGDYEKTAAKLSEEYQTTVYSGKTGLLGAADIIGDETLGMLYLDSPGQTDIGLVRVLFAVEPLKASVLGPIDVRPPRMYQNIGPLKDVRMSSQGYAGKSMLLVRIIDAQKAGPPENIDQIIGVKTVSFDNETVEDVNTVRTSVVEDIKRLAAMEKAARKAKEFIQLAMKDDWDKAIDKLNDTLDEQNKVKLEKQAGIRRISQADMLAFEKRYQGDPLGMLALSRDRAEQLLVNELFALIPAEANALAQPAVLEFKQAFRFYCIKSLTVDTLYNEQFDSIKAVQAVRGDSKDSDELAVSFYTPANILKRTNFKIIREEKTDQTKDTAEANYPATDTDSGAGGA